MDKSSLDLTHVKRVLETVLLVTQEPLPLAELRKLFDNELSHDMLRGVLEEMRDDWQGRGVELTHVASGWRFRARPEYQPFVERLNPQKPPRYSRAVLETSLSSPTSARHARDIEEIRGVVRLD